LVSEGKNIFNVDRAKHALLKLVDFLLLQENILVQTSYPAVGNRSGFNGFCTRFLAAWNIEVMSAGMKTAEVAILRLLQLPITLNTAL
jgi:hypothetical protein